MPAIVITPGILVMKNPLRKLHRTVSSIDIQSSSKTITSRLERTALYHPERVPQLIAAALGYQ
jgi:hypothetical protein